MNITIVTGFFLPVPPLRGGSTEKVWDRLAREFARAGHAVTLISRQWPGLPDREVADGVRHVRVPGAAHTAHLALNLWRDFRWGLRVARVLPPGDVVICNTVTLPAWLGRGRRSSGRVIAVVARMPKGHGRAYGAVDGLLSLSPAVSAALVRENPRLAGRIAPFPYPIDWGLHARAALNYAATTPLKIGYAGRIHPEKGIGLLVAAAGHLAERTDLPAWEIELVGPWTVPEGGGGDAYRASLLRALPPGVGDRLRFTGPEFAAEKLADRYSGMAVFCYPSLAERGETFGVAVAEAMAARSVPVVSQLPCFEGLVIPGRTGEVFDHRAADAARLLAGKIGGLLAEPARRHRLAASACEHVRQYDYATVARGVLADLARIAVRP